MKWGREADPQTYAVIGAAIEVHNCMGPALLELAYQRALSMELQDRGIPHQIEVRTRHKGRRPPDYPGHPGIPGLPT